MAKLAKKSPKKAEKRGAGGVRTKGRRSEPGANPDLPRFKRLLPVKLSHEELDKKSKAAGKLAAELDARRAKLMADVKAEREEIREDEARLRSMLKTLATGDEERDVPCYEEKDFSRNRVRVIRDDDGSLVEERTMSAAEKQIEADFGGEPAGAIASVGEEAEDEARERAREGADGDEEAEG